MRVALITGGASGFGKEVARRLVRRGDSVVLCDVNDADGQAVADELGATYLHCDVSDYDEVVATTKAAEEVHGGLDMVFLNAGISTGCGIGDDFDLARYRRAMGINLDGQRDVLGMWVGPTGGEGAKFWMTALTELRSRGVGDVFIVCCDGLKGLPESIRATWPLAEVQLRRALQISLGDPVALVESPFAAGLLALAAVALVAPFALQGLARFKASED